MLDQGDSVRVLGVRADATLTGGGLIGPCLASRLGTVPLVNAAVGQRFDVAG